MFWKLNVSGQATRTDQGIWIYTIWCVWRCSVKHFILKKKKYETRFTLFKKSLETKLLLDLL